MKNKKVVFKTEISKDFDSFEEAKEFALSIYNNKTEKEKNSENGDEFVYCKIIGLNDENETENCVFGVKSYLEDEHKNFIKNGVQEVIKEFLFKQIRLEYMIYRLNTIFMNDEEIDEILENMKYDNLFYKVNDDITIDFDFEILSGEEENINVFIKNIRRKKI